MEIPTESGGMVRIWESTGTVSIGIPIDSVEIPKECSDCTCYYNIKNKYMSKD
jgi:hypothetical protein